MFYLRTVRMSAKTGTSTPDMIALVATYLASSERANRSGQPSRCVVNQPEDGDHLHRCHYLREGAASRNATIPPTSP